MYIYGVQLNTNNKYKNQIKPDKSELENEEGTERKRRRRRIKKKDEELRNVFECSRCTSLFPWNSTANI